MKQPNIVFIQADQLAARQLHCYGGSVESSPTLDRLASEGTRFDRCYSSFPVCLPNRASFLTGRSPGVHGLINGRTVLRDDSPCYAQVLSRAGYRCGGIGKYHREGTSGPHPRRLDDLGFDEYAVVEDDKRGPYLEWIEAEHPDYYEMALGRLGKWKGWLTAEQEALREKAREEVCRPLMQASQYNHMFPSPFPAEVHDTTWITGRGLDFMARHRAEHPDRPFFCSISYVDPHDPYDPPAPYDTMFSPDEMPEPLPAEFLAQGPAVMLDYNALNGKVIREENPAIFKRAAALYHGSIRFMDDAIARVVRYLEDEGLADNTIVCFTTDHGDLMGDHGLMAKFVHYDGSVRNPLIVWGGGVESGVCRDLACALDFFPSFCDFAGIGEEKLPPLEGKSFAPACRGEAERDNWEEIGIMSADMHSVITADGWRLTRWLEEEAGQLFHLAEDPDEQQNLYESPEHAEKKIELLERLIKVNLRPYQIPQFRNLPAVEQERITSEKET
jgi:arylsulfatase A-like enzyme